MRERERSVFRSRGFSVSAKREKRLVVVLVAGVAAAVFATSIGISSARLTAAREKAALCRGQIARLQQSLSSQTELSSARERLTAEITRSRTLFYAPGEIDVYSFGTLVRKKLSARGMTVVRYQVTDLEGGSSLMLTVFGPIGSLVLFLEDVSESPRYWAITSLTLTMREGTATVDAVLRIGYEITGS